MKAILIDPFTQTITEVEHNGDYKQIYELIDAELFDSVRISENDFIFVDDEGLFQEDQAFFRVRGYPDPLAGKGLVLGASAIGESVDPVISLEELRRSVSWLV